MEFRTEFRSFKPVRRKFLAAVCHVFAAEYPERQHLFRSQLRLKFRVKIFPGRFRQKITETFLHLVVYDNRLLHVIRKSELLRGFGSEILRFFYLFLRYIRTHGIHGFGIDEYDIGNAAQAEYCA